MSALCRVFYDKFESFRIKTFLKYDIRIIFICALASGDQRRPGRVGGSPRLTSSTLSCPDGFPEAGRPPLAIDP